MKSYNFGKNKGLHGSCLQSWTSVNYGFSLCHGIWLNFLQYRICLHQVRVVSLINIAYLNFPCHLQGSTSTNSWFYWRWHKLIVEMMIQSLYQLLGHVLKQELGEHLRMKRVSSLNSFCPQLSKMMVKKQIKSVFKLYRSLDSLTAKVKWLTKQSTCTICFKMEVLEHMRKYLQMTKTWCPYLTSFVALHASSCLNTKIKYNQSMMMRSWSRWRSKLSWYAKTSTSKIFMVQLLDLQTRNGSKRW